MPLRPGKSTEIIHENIAAELRAGKPFPQAYAIAMRMAGVPIPRKKKKKAKKRASP